MNPAADINNDKLRIAFFLSHPTQHHAPWFKQLAARDDLALTVFYMSRAGMGKSLDVEFNEAFQWDIPLTEGYDHVFLEPGPGIKPDYLGLFLFNRGYGGVLGKNQWDVVCNTSYSCLGNWMIWAWCVRSGIPQIFHSDSTLLQERAPWRRIIKELPVRIFFRGISAFLFSGDNNAAYLRRFGVTAEKMFLCPIPIDLDRFHGYESAPDWNRKRAAIRKQFGFEEHDKIVTFCGKMIKRKRPQDLVAALKRLDRPDVKALFIGTGPLAEEIRQAWPGRAMVTGFINQGEIPFYLGTSDLLVMPSSFDAHPIVVSEAAALGVPAIISDHCGCFGPHDILRPGENGFVYPCGDVEGLAARLAELLLDDGLRAAFSARARELAITQSAQAAAESLANAARIIQTGASASV